MSSSFTRFQPTFTHPLRNQNFGTRKSARISSTNYKNDEVEIIDSGYTKRRIGNCSIISFSKEPASTDMIAKVRTRTAPPLTMYLKKLKLKPYMKARWESRARKQISQID